MIRIFSSVAALLLAGCSQFGPAQPVSQGPRLDPAPGKSVIYVVRTPMDARIPATVSINAREQMTTFPGFAHRWEVDPGTHRIASVAPENTSFTLSTAPGNVYYVEYTITGNQISGIQFASMRQISEQHGRVLLQQSVVN